MIFAYSKKIWPLIASYFLFPLIIRNLWKKRFSRKVGTDSPFPYFSLCPDVKKELREYWRKWEENEHFQIK